jgi:hypothetical protein
MKKELRSVFSLVKNDKFLMYNCIPRKRKKGFIVFLGHKIIVQKNLILSETS